MSASRCMHLAKPIAATPLESWAEQIALLPEVCPHADCGAPRSCRARIAEYMRVQYRVLKRLEQRGKAMGT